MSYIALCTVQVSCPQSGDDQLVEVSSITPCLGSAIKAVRCSRLEEKAEGCMTCLTPT